MTVVEVFADVVCPFTHVGLHRLVRERAALGADFSLRVRAWPLELVNGAPLDAALVADKVEALRAGVAPGLFRGFDPEQFPYTSLPALAVAAAAYRRSLAAGELASMLLRDALFEDGVDLTDSKELRRIADIVGVAVPFDAEQDVVDDWHEGRRRRVAGSPHFFVGEHDYFCPALRIEHPHGKGLRISFDPGSFDEFLRDCLTGDPRSRPRAAL